MTHVTEERALEEKAVVERKTLGFWIYLMTDCVLFAALFATFIVLRNATAGGPSGNELFDMPFVLVETMILLTSSFTVGMALLAAERGFKKQTLIWLAVTFSLGVAFLFMEISEFNALVAEGAGWQRSAFLSSFFTLVATHGLHIAIGLLWMVVVAVRLWRFKFKKTDLNRLALLGLFWHFLDIVWIFIFTIVYLIGGMA
ncbi:MAG: cytochrome o ubiquinol oxidase subunit III [Candidatus Microsaccharimonas sp.]